MLTTSLVITTLTVICMMICCTVVAHDPALQPATVNPFAMGQADPAADTVVMHNTDATLAGDWHRAELTSLSEVEELLDLLEAKNVHYREFEVVGNRSFVVRWR